jgi:hypothetical protein
MFQTRRIKLAKLYDDVTPTRGMFGLGVKWIGFIVGLVAIFYFLILPLMVGGKLIGREAQKFDAETSAQVYDNSRQYQQGINRDVARYCRDWKSSEGSAKVAIAELIRSTTDTYEGSLTPANQACIEEVN